jgi:hypothetical protein
METFTTIMSIWITQMNKDYNMDWSDDLSDVLAYSMISPESPR